MKTAVSGLQAVMLALMITLVICLSVGMQPINAQQFNYALCYSNQAEYERVYVAVHGDIYKEPLLVCYWTQAQTVALRAQLKTKYGY